MVSNGQQVRKVEIGALTLTDRCIPLQLDSLLKNLLAESDRNEPFGVLNENDAPESLDDLEERNEYGIDREIFWVAQQYLADLTTSGYPAPTLDLLFGIEELLEAVLPAEKMIEDLNRLPHLDSFFPLLGPYHNYSLEVWNHSVMTTIRDSEHYDEVMGRALEKIYDFYFNYNSPPPPGEEEGYIRLRLDHHAFGYRTLDLPEGALYTGIHQAQNAINTVSEWLQFNGSYYYSMRCIGEDCPEVKSSQFNEINTLLKYSDQND